MIIDSGLIQSGEFSLQYQIVGEGLPAIVIGSALFYERAFSQNLRSHFKMAFVDHRGFAPGNQCQDLSQYTLDRLVEDVELARATFGFEQVVLIGHSGHGFIALEYAKKYPQRVSHLVMMCVSPDFSEASHAAAARYFEESACPDRKAALAENVAKLPAAIAAAPDRAFVTYCLLMGPKNWFDYRYDAQHLWQDVAVNMAMFDYVWGQIFRDIDITNHLDRVTMPVLLVLGRHDYVAPPAYLWEPMRDRFHNLTIRVFETSGHYPQLEEANLFDRELLAWLADHEPSLANS